MRSTTWFVGIVFAVFILLSLGIVMLTSTSIWVEKDVNYQHLKKHITWICIGLSFGSALLFFNYRKLKSFWCRLPLFLFGNFLLFLCYIPSIGIERNGEKRWIAFPIIKQFQPSELVKVTTMIVLASYFYKNRTSILKFNQGFLIPSFLLGLPFLLIFFEKDMGTALALGVSGIFLFIVAGVRISYLLPLIGLGGGLFMLVMRLNPNRWSRFIAFLDLESHRLGAGLQQWRALLAFRNGQFSGTGLGASVEKHGYLPYAHTDFIFPILAEELGILFSLLTIFSFLTIVLISMFVALKSDDHFAKLIVTGLASLICVQAVMNISVATALMPNTGLPLPFISYGGSNLVFNLGALGILLSIIRNASRTYTGLNKSKKIIRL